MFGGGFKGSKCKTLLRLAMARIKLLRNKRDIQIKQMRKDIAQLLAAGQEPSARIRIENIAREQNILAAYDIVELFCELIIVRLPMIESQKLCPLDLKEGVCSLVFASQRCADLPELLQVRSLFASKYGKEFVAAATELRPECGVNRRIIEKLSVRAPSGETKLKLLSEIAAEHNVDWDPANTEAELMKQPEDLLDGPKSFFGPSQTPIIDLQPLIPKSPETVSHSQRPPSAAPAKSSPPVAVAPSEPDEDTVPDDKKQYIPFLRPMHGKGVSEEKSELPPKVNEGSRSVATGSSSVPSSKENSHPRGRNEGRMDYQKRHEYDDVAAAAAAAAKSADRAVAAAREAAEMAKTHPSRRESLSRRGSREEESSSSEDSEPDGPPPSKIKAARMSKQEPARHERSEMKPHESAHRQEKSDAYKKSPSEEKREASVSRSNSEDKEELVSRKSIPEEKQELSFRRSNSEDKQEGLFRSSNSGEMENTRKKFPDDPPVKVVNAPVKFDGEDESFWKTSDEDWRQGSYLKPDRDVDSDRFFDSDRTSLYGRNTDIFKTSERDVLAPSRSRNTSYSNTAKIFSNSYSGKDLFKSTSGDGSLRSSFDEAPVFDSQQGLATPKFDEDEPSYNKSSRNSMDFSFKPDLDSQMKDDYGRSRSKAAFDENWRTSSSSHFPEETSSAPRNFNYAGSTDHGMESPQHYSRATHDTLSDSPREDSISPRSVDTGEKAESSYEDHKEHTPPVPSKSRRTRGGSYQRENMDRSGGIPPVPRSSDYPSSGEVGSPTLHSFDDSPGRRPRTSLAFYSSPSKRASSYDSESPPKSAPHLSRDTAGDSSPGTGSFQNSRTSSGLDRKDSPSGLERQTSPSAPPLHPNLPDIDDLTARFEALKGKARR